MKRAQEFSFWTTG